MANQSESFKIIGSSGADSITCGSGDDSIAGAANDTLLDGGAGTDSLRLRADFTSTGDGQIANIERIGLASAATLNLANQTEAFTIIGSSGADSIAGGSGDDTIMGAQNDTLLDGGAGSADVLRVRAAFISTGDGQIANIEQVRLASSVTLSLANQTEAFTITGSSGNDNITGGSGADRISAGAGNDTIVGAANDTLLDGGAGTDTLQVWADFTSTGDAQIAGIEFVTLTTGRTRLNLSNQTEAFTITGSSDGDRIISGSGDDTIIGTLSGASSTSSDIMDGGAGYDTLQLGVNFDASDDTRIANIERLVLTAAVEVFLYNQTEGFTIIGSSGDDFIGTGGAVDSISAGDGNDTLWVSSGGHDSLLDGGDGTDTLEIYGTFTSSSDSQLVNVEEVTVLEGGGTADLSNQTEALKISAQYHAARLVGGFGADTIVGGVFDDTIVGAQNDILLDGGFLGFPIGQNHNTLELGADFTSISDEQVTRIQDVVLTAAVTLDLSNQVWEDFTITGSSGADSITAASGDDIIVGAQNDTLLDGRGGTDQLRVGADFTSTGDGQIVRIEDVLLTSAVTLNLSNQTEGFVITGSSGADSITTGSGNDVVVGAQNDTLLDGGGGTGDQLQVGADFTSTSDAQIANMDGVLLTAAVTLNLANQTESFVILGSGGDDTITGGSGNDTMDGSGGIDTLSYASAGSAVTVNLALSGVAQNTVGAGIDTLTGFENLTGTGFNDTLTGNSGNNVLRGGAGNDIFVFDFLGGVDTISDFAHGNDLLDFRSIFAGHSVAELIATGSLGWAESGGNTIVSFDVDTNAGPFPFQPAFVLTGTGLSLSPTDFIV